MTELRRTRESLSMSVAKLIAERGTCDRKRVGAVIVRDGRPISWGYNGAPPGVPHCDESNHGWSTDLLAGKMLNLNGTWIDVVKAGYYIPGADNTASTIMRRVSEHTGCRNATHAEANALAFAARQGISTDAATLFVTVSPCDVCARLLIAAGIEKVYYDEEYRDRSGLELLERALIPCQQLLAL